MPARALRGTFVHARPFHTIPSYFCKASRLHALELECRWVQLWQAQLVPKTNPQTLRLSTVYELKDISWILVDSTGCKGVSEGPPHSLPFSLSARAARAGILHGRWIRSSPASCPSFCRKNEVSSSAGR